MEYSRFESSIGEKLMKKIIAATLLLPLLTFGSPVLAQVIIDFQSQPTKEQLIQVVESATRDKNYSTALRVANNAIKQFPNLAEAYFYRAIALSNLGKPEEAKLNFKQAKMLYVTQLKNAKTSAQEKSEAQLGLQAVEYQLQILNHR